MKKIFLVYSIIIFLSSCNFVKDDSVTVLSFYDVKISGAKIGERIYDLSMIKLETSGASIIGNINQLRIYNEMIYIYDNQNNSLLVFDLKGKYISKISASGRGPGEYELLRDFYIDEARDEIVLLGSPDKLLWYDIDGEFKREQSLNFTPLKFTLNHDGSYYFWNGTNCFECAPLVKTDSSFNIIESYFDDVDEPLTTSNMFTKYNNHTYLRPFFDVHEKIIYELSENSVSKKYLVDFGSRNWPKSKTISRDSDLRQKDYIYGVTDFFEGDRWISFKLTSEKIVHFALYDKKSGESFWWQSFIANTLPETILSDISFVDEDCFYSISYPFYFKKYLNIYKSQASEYDYNKIDESLEEFYSVIDEVDEFDNPLIFRYSIR